MLNDFYLNLFIVTFYTFDKQPLTMRPLKLSDVTMINDNVKTSDQKVFGYLYAILAACMDSYILYTWKAIKSFTHIEYHARASSQPRGIHCKCDHEQSTNYNLVINLYEKIMLFIFLLIIFAGFFKSEDQLTQFYEIGKNIE